MYLWCLCNPEENISDINLSCYDTIYIGDDFVLFYTRKTPIAEHVSASKDLIIGTAMSGNTPENSTITRMFDDIQIYSRALTTDELAVLIDASKLKEGNDTTSYHLKSLDNRTSDSEAAKLFERFVEDIARV